MSFVAQIWIEMQILMMICFVDSTDYLDHVTCDTANFELRGISNDAIYSLDGNTRIVMQSDGNLVLSSRIDSTSNWVIKWQTNSYQNTVTWNRPTFAIQRDGNLVIYADIGWHSDTWKDWIATYHFVVSNGGYAYLMDNTQSVDWSTDNSVTSYPTYNILPTQFPSQYPTEPTINPTIDPTPSPTKNPTPSPTIDPTKISNPPTVSPTNDPTTDPTIDPTPSPTINPSLDPTNHPITSQQPSSNPSVYESISVTIYPTKNPINHQNGEIIETTQFVIIDTRSQDIKPKRSNDLFWSIIGVLSTFICISIICIGIYMIRKINKDRLIEKENIHSGMQLNAMHNAAIKIVATDSNLFVIRNKSVNDDEVDNTGSSQYDRGSHFSSNPKAITPISPVLMAVNDNVIIDNDEDESPGNDEIEAIGDDTPGNTESNDDDGRITGESDEKFDNNDSDEKQYKYGNDDIWRINKIDHKSDTYLVKEWLRENVGFPQYYDIMIKNGFESLDIIKEITDREDLKEIGIALKEHQDVILMEVKKLRMFEEENKNSFVPYNIGYNVELEFGENENANYEHEGDENDEEDIDDKIDNNQQNVVETVGNVNNDECAQ